MPIITATRTSSIYTDLDGDGVFDPGDTLLTRIRISNAGTDATGIQVTDTLSGITLVAGSIQVTPIAYDDGVGGVYSLVGNTPMTFNAGQGLLANDIDPNGAGGNAGLVVSSVDTTGTQGTVSFNADGSFTFTPTAGFAGTTTFKYFITDAEGLGNVTEGVVTMTVTDPVWYVNAASGSDVTGNGTFNNPFASLTPLSTGGSSDALDNADDTIFVYNAGTYANASIVLETNQKLYGDGHAFVVNGLTIGANASNTTLTHAGAAVTLAGGNTIDGLDLVGNATGAIGIQDGNATVGSLTITGTNITGQGQILDIDQGGTLNVTLGNIASTGSTGANGGVVDLTGVGGTVTVTGTTTINGTHSQAGIDISGNTGGLTVDFQGNVTVNNGANTAINISTNTGTNSVTFSGGLKDIDTTSGTALNMTGNTTSTTVGFTNGGLDVDTTSGTGLNMDNTTLVVSGAGNAVNTATGAVLAIANSAIGAGNVTFATLGASGTVAAGNGITINNLDGGTFSGGNVTIVGTAGLNADGLSIQGGSSSTFSFASATIGGGAAGTNPIAGDAIELNGANGAVTFTTVNLQGSAGVGVNIVSATNAVTISGGTIGTTNDPGGDGVNVSGGSGAVTVAAAITKTTGGNELVDVSNHATGAISFSGALNTSSGGGGIRLVNNTSGNIDFTNSAVNLNTGTLNAITFTNTAGTGANVTFSGGNLDVDTTSGTGINATNSTVGAGSLTISGANNSVAATTGGAINVNGVTLNATLHDVSVSGNGTTTGVFLKNTGAGGQFIVTGDVGTSNLGTGGTIKDIGGGDIGSSTGAATTGTAIYMENVSNVSLTNMIFGSTTAGENVMNNFGIRGENVNNFTLRDSEFRGTFGTNEGQDEGAIRFGTENNTSVTGLKGTALFEGNNIQGGFENNLSVFLYGANSLNMTVRDNATSGDQAVFGLNSTLLGDDSLHVESGSTSNLTLLVNGVDFNGARADQVQVLAIGNTTQNVTITNNTMVNNHTNIVSGGGGVTLLGGDTAASSNVNLTYNFSNNTVKGAVGDAVRAIYTGTAGTISAVIANNTIGTPGGGLQGGTAAGSSGGGTGIDAGIVRSSGTGSLTMALRVEGNTIRDIQNAFGGIILTSNMAGTVGTSRLEATVKNNSLAEVGGDVLAGLYAIVGGQSSAAVSNDAAQMGLVITGNTLVAGASTGGSAIFLDQLSGNAHYYIPGYTVNANTSHGEFRPSGGGGTASTNLNTFFGATNTLTNGPFPPPAPVVANSKVDATNTTGITNTAFVLPVPAMAAAPDVGNGWEDDSDTLVTAPPRDPDPVPATDDTSDGDDGSGDTGSGGTGSGDTGSGDTGSGGTGDPAPTPGGGGVITLAELGTLVDAAIQRWIDAGATPQQVQAMYSVQFGIADMTGIYVGTSTQGVINIDSDGAGYGWFVDTTPGEDSEFDGSGTRLTADAGGAADGRLDLLTVLMHELGHQIGLDDVYQNASGDDVMFGYMHVGERRLPASGEAAGAQPGTIGATAFALTPVNVGTLPQNKSVDVFFKSTIDAQSDGFIVNLNNNATISGGNFSNVVANEINALDSLTLGNTVFLDANLNNAFDAGEGVVGVALQLYADTNNSGGWDAGDALLGSTTTIANGAYTFAGLAPGDYIVVVTAANFGVGQPLAGKLSIAGGNDPDDNVDNDDNGLSGVAGLGAAIASQTITLSYNNEGPSFTPGPGVTGEDTNNTLDFGFFTNQPPVANDDSVSVAEDSGANDLTSQLLLNDTDPENDTRTIVSGTNGTHGTVSVVAGVLTYTPTGNYNGTDTFTYTIDDGQGHQDTATANVTITAVNDPVTGAAPLTLSPNEDAVNVAVAGMSISDVDAALAPAGVYDVTLTSTNGTMTLTTITGLTFGTGDGTGDATMTFHGTLADINTALASAKYTPTANYNGAATITLQVTDTFGATVATGTGSATNDSDVINVTVNSVNDAPAGADNSRSASEGTTTTFTSANFSTGMTDPNDSPANAFNGVKITTLPGAAAGVIKLNGVAISAGDVITKTQIDNNELTFDPAVGSGGTNPTFTFQVQDNGGTTNGGVDLDQSANTFTLNIGVANAAPALDLDADNSNAAGTGFASSYTEGGAAAAIGDTDVSITDADAGDDIVGATITITNAETGDKLNVGALPAGITLDGTSTDTVVKLVGIAGTTAANFEAAIEAITFSSTSDDPTDHGTNTARTVTVVVNDGVSNSNTATATVTVTDVNDAPSGTSSTITAIEDTFRLIQAGDLGFNDVDGTFASVTISGVTGGSIYFDADGTAGGGAPVAVVLPQTYTAQDLIDGKVSYKAPVNANGSGLGTITFAVTDDDGAIDGTPNVLTVDVTAVNDSPVLAATSPVGVTEQVSTYILTGATVADVDLDAKNGGNGDYAGAVFSVNRNPASDPVDDFELVAGTNFTISGINLKTLGGQIFGHISTDSNGAIAITFTSLEAPATSALVDEVIQHIRYFYTGDNPPASVTLAVGFTDGSPGGGQGAGASGLDVELVTVNITAVNDAPVNSLGGTIGTGEDAIDAWLSGMSISDPDAIAATDNVVVTFHVDNGTLDIRTDVVNGIQAADITGGADDSDTITVTATLNEINATLAASNGLTYSPDLNFNGNDTLTVTTNDQGHNGTDPGLTGTGSSEEDVDTRTISVSAVNDAPVAQPDAVATPENVVLTGGAGALFANNGSGVDSDVDGDPLTISAVTGGTVGVQFTLPSGAKLTVNADGSYSYDPNGKFNTLTNTSGGESGAVNTSAIDTFQYTLTGGNTVTVTVTVNGVASVDDWLMGDGTNNTITGTPQPDFFFLNQGGNDTVSGLASNDGFYFGAAFDENDVVNGGAGVEQLGLQGDYSGANAVVLGAGTLIDVEQLILMPGNDTRFGAPGTAFYDYDITTDDANVAAGAVMTIDAARLRVGENLTFDGSAESDGAFFIYAGKGVDTLTGGDGDDGFLFRGDNKFGASDTVDGGAGEDQIGFRGSYTVTFTAATMTNVEGIVLISGHDLRFGADAGDLDYNFTTHDGNVAAGETMIVDGGTLREEESLAFNGSDESDGHFTIFGGRGNDVLTGGDLSDTLRGGRRGDTLTGGLGNDTFRYDRVEDSNSTERDGIQDFTLGDVIDLTRIDADTTVGADGNQAFSFIGSAAFSNTAGELRFENISLGGPIWLVQGDTDGNGVSDFEVVLVVTDANPITSSDFLL